MNLLLDTQVALWAITDSPKLGDKARALLLLPSAVIWVSTASIWEVAIKHSLGRGDMPVSAEEAIRYFRESGYQFLPIEPEHAATIERLPPHHQDPFDRMLVAQAMTEPMRLLSRDAQLSAYGDWVEPV